MNLLREKGVMFVQKIPVFFSLPDFNEIPMIPIPLKSLTQKIFSQKVVVHGILTEESLNRSN